LFAAVLGGSGEFELLARIIFKPGSNQGLILGAFESFKTGIQNTLPTGADLWSNLLTLLINAPLNLISLILVLVAIVLIALFVIWLAVVSQVGLIRNIDSIIDKNPKPTINEGLEAGVENFWPIITVQLIYKAILFIVFVLLGKEIILLTLLPTAGIVIHIILLILFSLIMIVISFVIRYQIIFIILKKEKIITALKSAWKLFIGNWLISLEMAFILFIVYLSAAYLTAFIFALFLAVPLVFLTYSYQIPAIFILVIGAISISAVPVIIFLITAIVNTFQWASWTLLFKRISAGKSSSKIIRLSAQSPNLKNPFNKK